MTALEHLSALNRMLNDVQDEMQGRFDLAFLHLEPQGHGLRGGSWSIRLRAKNYDWKKARETVWIFDSPLMADLSRFEQELRWNKDKFVRENMTP